MSEYSDPRFEIMRRYTPTMRPYVEITDDIGKYHAQVEGWSRDEIFIAYPPKVVSGPYNDERVVKWVPVASAKRIRRADSIWASTEDNYDWHSEEDKKIEYRADPWTVYLQEEGGN